MIVDPVPGTRFNFSVLPDVDLHVGRPPKHEQKAPLVEWTEANKEQVEELWTEEPWAADETNAIEDSHDLMSDLLEPDDDGVVQVANASADDDPEDTSEVESQSTRASSPPIVISPVSRRA
jgi:hypothetical protein